ncbi:uncharacterized protein SPAPADRAFT_48460 [Spathaspora passalidarum NRRL Y-27907]|uniref:Altered inheritance of mitochondria protein 24, mitochondrial n=1 Tax=Spathaspora passalidarum (strain NRRL Y-27907 / 11-Y1) TaxID=619300 RepID=G3AH40_SPAPN|nr:uncharacterized protein SPAPADRAFT_48460 [Spathaspora passalidarum NRRL Y-27907]EGW35470.1 hypothetical protein SPAPADRAFT_48460 [Spathaspora passalidarum NRRL Y-27907]
MKLIKQLFNKTKVIQKPLVTGNGPFIELPKFIPIDEQLLNITLPKHSSLNIRNGSLLAINGNITDIQSVPSNSYQKLTSSGFNSLVINGNYSIVDTKDTWTILNEQDLIAYTGYNFDVTPTSILSKFRSIQTKGDGTIVLNGNLFNIELAANEEILVNPNALIATTSTVNFQVLNKAKYSKLDWALPTQSIFGSLTSPITSLLDKITQYNKDIVSKITQNNSYRNLLDYTGPAKTRLKNLVDWIVLYATTIFKRKPIYIKIKGPTKLLINNETVVSNTKVFTRKEIKTIYSRH